jgi:hypothetical protein
VVGRVVGLGTTDAEHPLLFVDGRYAGHHHEEQPRRSGEGR